MMKKNKLKLSMLLATSMFFLVACGNSEEEVVDSTSNELNILSTWEISDVRPSKDDTVVGRWLENELDMDLVLTTIPNEAVSTKINALIASDDLPTLLFKTGDSSAIEDINKLGKQGAFLNINEHLEKVPNFSKYLENDFIRRELSDDEGNVYAFTKMYSDNNIMYSTPIIREDLLEGSNYSSDSITTIEELTEVLEYLTESNGAPAWIQRRGYDEFMQQSGLLWNLANKPFYDYTIDSFTHPILVERTKDYVAWLHELRTKNIIHPDWAIMTDETWEGLLASNQGYFTIDRMNIIGDNNFSKEFDWQPVNYPEIGGESFLQPKQAETLTTTGWVINANSSEEEIERALKFVDFLYNEENHKTLTLGIEDETYTTEDANTAAGIRWLIQIYGENADNPEAELLFTHGIQSFTRLQTEIDMTAQPGEFPTIMYSHVDEIVEHFGGFRPSAPTVSFTSEQQEQVNQLETALNTYYDENVIKFIEGNRSMDEWDAFVQEMKDRSIEEVISIYNSAYEEYLKK